MLANEGNLSPSAPITPPPEDPLSLNAFVMRQLFFAGKLSDQFLPPKEFLIVKTKSVSDWPDRLREKLRPYMPRLSKD